jgi:hypothetical protein
MPTLSLSIPAPALVLALGLAIAGPAHAEIEAADLPGDADWYVHADLAAMRSVESGSPLYDWLDGEVFVELNEDLGIDVNNEVDSITAFADAALGTVVIVEGPVTKATRDELLAIAAAKAKLDTLSFEGKTYYHVRRDAGAKVRKRSIDGFDDAAWFTFDVEDRIIITSDRKQLEALLETGGRIAGSASHDGSLFVLTADKEFVQAGALTAKLADDDTDWDSNILRNTEKAALLVSDRNGLIAVEAQLISKDPTITQSLGGIINGLISLQAFNADLDPEILAMIQNTKIKVTDNVLSVSTVFDPDVIFGMIDENSDGGE